MSNPVRTCIGCARTDDHPRHVLTTVDGASISYHMDCHVIAANCEVCKEQLAGVGGVDGNPKGQQLREHLMTTGTDPGLPGWTAPTDEELGFAPASSREG